MPGRARIFYFMCPACEVILSDTRPTSGDIGQCPECSTVLIYGDGLKVRVASDGERRAILERGAEA